LPGVPPPPTCKPNLNFNFNFKCTGNCTPPVGRRGYPEADSWCGDLTPGANAHCWALYGCDTDCFPTESTANNYIALRR
jgi:hypothetical protein